MRGLQAGEEDVHLILAEGGSIDETADRPPVLRANALAEHAADQGVARFGIDGIRESDARGLLVQVRDGIGTDAP
jgi:hypothetical protein